MTFLALPLALLLPAIFGWTGLCLIEGKHPVLFYYERWVMGTLLGLTLLLFVQFLLNVSVGLPFTFLSFVAVQGIATLITGTLWYRQKEQFPPSPLPAPRTPLPRVAAWALGILLTWSAVKLALVGTTFLILIPSYLQDTLANWNLRGKVLYETAQMTLVLPNEDPLTSPKGVSSYPPTVPMAKVLLADFAGEWSEPLINAIHIVWYVCALALLYFALRRYVPFGWALLGTYLLMSLPLYLMHGANAYADAFMSAHVLAVVGLLFHASRAKDKETAASFLRLASIAGGLLVFTKNEGLLVYLPPLIVCILLTTWNLKRAYVLPQKRATFLAMRILLGIACIAVPWLLFKWTHELTFGNGKPFTSLGFAWQKGVTYSIIVNTFSEGNWLFLFPLFFGLILWKWRFAFSTLLVPMLFFLFVYFGQVSLYLFTALSREAIMQTGYARGLIQLMPVIVLLTTLLLYEVRDWITSGLAAINIRFNAREV